MIEIRLTATQGRNTATNFLDEMWKYCKDRFTEKELEEFGGYLTVSFSDPAFFQE